MIDDFCVVEKIFLWKEVFGFIFVGDKKGWLVKILFFIRFLVCVIVIFFVNVFLVVYIFKINFYGLMKNCC